MSLLSAMHLEFQHKCLGLTCAVVIALMEMCWRLKMSADMKQENTGVKQEIHAGMLQNLQQLTYSVSKTVGSLLRVNNVSC